MRIGRCSGKMHSFLRKKCPTFWQLLNRRAQLNLPSGLIEFISDTDAIVGREHLRSADDRIKKLIAKASARAVGDAYRRDLSGVRSPKALSEILCEITLVESLAGISSGIPVLRPRNAAGTACDVKIAVEGTDVYAEIKRFADDFPGTCGFAERRAVEKSPTCAKMPNLRRPRSMDLYSKLKSVHRQFPLGNVNTLFIFHPSVGNTLTYIQQALYGDAPHLSGSNDRLARGDGLFALSEWEQISACILCRINDGTVSVPRIWSNPRAAYPVPEFVCEKIRACE
jgi:hypothetical protein